MSFISKNSHQHITSGATTKWINLGKPEAEGEKEELKDFFEDFLNINDQISEGKFVITGRKGAGKSAYVQYLLNNEGEDYDMYCRFIPRDRIVLEKMIHAIPDTVGSKNEIIFEWIVLTSMVSLILRHKNGNGSKGYKELSEFEKKNSGLSNVDKWMLVEENITNGYTVNFSSLLKAFPAIFDKSFSRKTMRAPFYTLIPQLSEIVKEMLGYHVYRDINFFIIFDDLDVNFDLKDKNHKEDLLSLLRIARKYNTQVFPNKDTRVLIMLRDDIALQLDGVSSDKNKFFSSYEYNLNWYDRDLSKSEEESFLRKFINKRISVCFNKLTLKYDKRDPWKSLVENEAEEYGKDTAFKYILNYTFFRPRDLVAFFNGIGNMTIPMPIKPADVKKLLISYVEWNATEIKDELSNLYTDQEIGKLFNVFSKMAIPNSKWAYNDILDFFIGENLCEYDFEKMIEYNFIIPKDEKDFQYFTYRERPRVNKNSDYYYCLPKCIYVYFTKQIVFPSEKEY